MSRDELIVALLYVKCCHSLIKRETIERRWMEYLIEEYKEQCTH